MSDKLSDERPEHVCCIGRTHADFLGQSWCGRSIRCEFHFMDLDHATENNRQNGRLVPCEACVTAAVSHLASPAPAIPAEPGDNAPCPFCRAHLSPKNASGFYVHPENGCILEGHEYDDDGSIQKWNSRSEAAQAVPADLRGLLVECRESLDRLGQAGIRERLTAQIDAIDAAPATPSKTLSEARKQEIVKSRFTGAVDICKALQCIDDALKAAPAIAAQVATHEPLSSKGSAAISGAQVADHCAPAISESEDAVAWQIRRISSNGAPLNQWETCTKELYDATLATGRYAGYEKGPRCEVRELVAARKGEKS